MRDQEVRPAQGVDQEPMPDEPLNDAALTTSDGDQSDIIIDPDIDEEAGDGIGG